MTGEETKTESPSSEQTNVEAAIKTKMVPESTIASLRKSYTDEIKKIKSSLDSEIQSKIEIQSKLESLGGIQEKYSALESEHKVTMEKLYIGELHRQTLLKERVESLRQSVASRGGVKPEALKEASYEKLAALDEALTMFGKPQSKDFVTKIQGESGVAPTKTEALQAMLEEAKHR